MNFFKPSRLKLIITLFLLLPLFYSLYYFVIYQGQYLGSFFVVLYLTPVLLISYVAKWLLHVSGHDYLLYLILGALFYYLIACWLVLWLGKHKTYEHHRSGPRQGN